ncbi:Uma2 family endonuclease [cf. Phormidesmis sp. LEGE 11477]|nr:Uma2 family endonuclease [cf. Phormidesmis sp. LEGE 11477]MBE9063665.1 Uma2 family endonuclease [cf. Phormidesmis sp. LEGE 11477]
MTVSQFVAQYHDVSRYELIDGEVFDLEPTGRHEQVAAFIDRKLNVQIDQLELPYFVLQRGLLKPLGDLTAFRPDVMVVDTQSLAQEPLWAKESMLTLGDSVKFVAEAVSSNWQNDYARKFEDYAVLGIPEYWIVDYEGLGGELFIGRPKQPTLTLCTLGEDDRYQKTILRDSQLISSPTFLKMKLTAEQVLNAGRVTFPK